MLGIFDDDDQWHVLRPHRGGRATRTGWARAWGDSAGAQVCMPPCKDAKVEGAASRGTRCGCNELRDERTHSGEKGGALVAIQYRNVRRAARAHVALQLTQCKWEVCWVAARVHKRRRQLNVRGRPVLRPCALHQLSARTEKVTDLPERSLVQTTESGSYMFCQVRCQEPARSESCSREIFAVNILGADTLRKARGRRVP